MTLTSPQRYERKNDQLSFLNKFTPLCTRSSAMFVWHFPVPQDNGDLCRGGAPNKHIPCFLAPITHYRERLSGIARYAVAADLGSGESARPGSGSVGAADRIGQAPAGRKPSRRRFTAESSVTEKHSCKEDVTKALRGRSKQRVLLSMGHENCEFKTASKKV